MSKTKQRNRIFLSLLLTLVINVTYYLFLSLIHWTTITLKTIRDVVALITVEVLSSLYRIFFCVVRTVWVLFYVSPCGGTKSDALEEQED
jgi:hypothetical protein